MQASMLLGLFDWIGDFFKALFDLIPKVMYLLYASLACVIDVLQLFFRKLAGLDVYYVEGKAITGDLVTNFITGILGINKDNLTYSALSTVFYSMIVFGLVIVFVSTIVAIIKSHYTYDEKAAKGPMQYVYTAGKAVINMIAVPIIVVLGMYVSEALLTALDSITSTTSGNIVQMYGDKANNLVSINTVKGATDVKYELASSYTEGETYYTYAGNNIYNRANVTAETWPEPNTTYYIFVDNRANSEKTYIYYDIFGFGAQIEYGKSAADAVKGWTTETAKELGPVGAKSETFSGSLFKCAAYNANRARSGHSSTDTISADVRAHYSGVKEGELFSNATTYGKLADMVDMAFACNLHLKNRMYLDYSGKVLGQWVSPSYFTQFSTFGISCFSKFNIGSVWYYYDLWQFNFIVGFAGCIVCTTIFLNIIMGLMVRLFMCIVLFLVAPPLFGLAPLDGGNAGTQWRKKFMENVLMPYGAVVGMNLMLMILPYMNTIDFFNIPIADFFARTLLIIVGLITIKAVIATLSALIGGADANKTGADISQEVQKVTGKAVGMTLGAAKVGAKAFGANMAPVRALAGRIDDATGNRISGAAHAVGNFARDRAQDVRGFLTGTTAEVRAQRALRNTERQRQKDEFLNNLQGHTLDENRIRQEAKEAGFTGAEIRNLIDAANNAGVAAGGTFNEAAIAAARRHMATNMVGGRQTDAAFHAYTQANYVDATGTFVGYNTNQFNQRVYNDTHTAQQRSLEDAQALGRSTARYRMAQQVRGFGQGVFSFAGDTLKDNFEEFENVGKVATKDEKRKKKEEIQRQTRTMQAAEAAAESARTTAQNTTRSAAHHSRDELARRWRDYQIGHGGANPPNDLQDKWRRELGLPDLAHEDMDNIT